MSSSDNELAMRCAIEQVAIDIPYVKVIDAAIFRKIINEDNKLTSSNTQATSDRWYVDLTLQHHEDESQASALYRVWRTPQGLQALKVDIR